MILINGKPKKIMAAEGKYIRAKNDIYVAEHTDENGNLVKEYFPYYSTVIFVPDIVTEEKMYELYIEEDIK